MGRGRSTVCRRQFGAVYAETWMRAAAGCHGSAGSWRWRSGSRRWFGKAPPAAIETWPRQDELAQVRHELARELGKSFRISSGSRRVCTTFAIDFEVGGEREAK